MFFIDHFKVYQFIFTWQFKIQFTKKLFWLVTWFPSIRKIAVRLFLHVGKREVPTIKEGMNFKVFFKQDAVHTLVPITIHYSLNINIVRSRKVLFQWTLIWNLVQWCKIKKSKNSLFFTDPFKFHPFIFYLTNSNPIQRLKFKWEKNSWGNWQPGTY